MWVLYSLAHVAIYRERLPHFCMRVCIVFALGNFKLLLYFIQTKSKVVTKK